LSGHKTQPPTESEAEMRAIMVLFDTLNRRYLPPYGAVGVHAPNFERLAKHAVTFDTCYGGSMPCMPARREIHTGRYNFLHRGWSPLEPFDDSVPEILSQAGVYTHMVSDHNNYWADGGANYHNRYDSFEFFRGQHGDPWKGHVEDPPELADLRTKNQGGAMGMKLSARKEGEDAQAEEDVETRLLPGVRQDMINRLYQDTIDKHNQTLTFDAGLEFMQTNKDADKWFLQIECFDPHEPFFSYDEHRSHYIHDYEGDHFDWPHYMKVSETDEEIDHLRAEYKALLTFCDQSLGRVLDFMDANNMWEDTLLMVCTDHGLLMGERGWWGKCVQPWYDENIHNPLFIWDPRYGARGERREALVQTVDFGPTLLDFFGVPIPELMQGVPIGPVIADGTPQREAGLFGQFGAHVNVTDGRYVYMRSCVTPENQPLEEYLLNPSRVAGRFSPEELHQAELSPPLPFTKGAPVIKVPGFAWGNPWAFGTMLFDLETDPGQTHPLVDDELELRMATMMVEQMRAADAPESQYLRLGLPVSGPVTAEHLLCRKQHHLAAASAQPLPRLDDVTARLPDLVRPLGELLDDASLRPIVIDHLPMLRNEQFAREVRGSTIYSLAVATPGINGAMLERLGEDLTKQDHANAGG